MQKTLLQFKVNEIPEGQDLVAIFDGELEGNGPRDLANMILDKNVKIAAVFAGNDYAGYRYVIGSRSEDVRPYAKELNALFQGRGGGKPEMVQGSLCGDEEKIKEALEACKEKV